MEKNKLSIVIVNWNTCKLLEQCLLSICIPQLAIAHEIIVVDNASSDGSVDMLKNNFPEVKIIQNSDNAGFAKANNQALEFVKGEYILLLNSDTIIQDVMIFTKWLDFMDANHNVGASGCKLVFQNGLHQVGDAGYRPSMKTVFAHAFFLAKFFPKLCKGIFIVTDDKNDRQYVDWVCGAALLIRRSILKEVGGLDEQNFMYAEDVEFGCRMRDKGYLVAYLPSMQIIHLQGGSGQDDEVNLSVTWLTNLRRLFKQLNSHVWLSQFFFNTVMGSGFLLRFLLYEISGVLLSNKGTLNKSKQMLCYARNCFIDCTKLN